MQRRGYCTYTPGRHFCVPAAGTLMCGFINFKVSHNSPDTMCKVRNV